VPLTPLRTCAFLNKFDATIGCKFNVTNKFELLTQSSIMNMFDWLLCYMLDKSYKKLEHNLKQGKDLFTARNENQVFYSKTLAIIFIEVRVFYVIYKLKMITKHVERISFNRLKFCGFFLKL
jgi:hypothetical protein